MKEGESMNYGNVNILWLHLIIHYSSFLSPQYTRLSVVSVTNVHSLLEIKKANYSVFS